MLKPPSVIRKKLSIVVILLSILFLITACGDLAELDTHSTVSRFQKSEDLYKASLRWGEWPTFFHLIRPRTAQATPLTTDAVDNKAEAFKPPSEELLNHLDTFKVSGVEVLSSAMNEKQGTGKTRFQIDYYRDDSTKINSFRQSVDWWYDKPSNNWYTDTPLPEEFALPRHPTIKLSPEKKY